MTMKIEIRLTQSDIRRAAMVRDGLSPQLLAMKRGTQRQRDRKASARAGQVKHKGRSFDC